ncbi:hypothetical protein ACIO8F_33345 [Streptomyces sp. NPDC087228]|uniref:hypothetical protein n=1 Tax=Streptomyces sp. NPDC087228 TaxID=3365772 RepID=UPI003825E73F
MHHPARTPTGPADLALPLALVAELLTGLATEPATGLLTDGAAERVPGRVPEVRTAAARERRAARRRAAAVRG